MRIGDSMPEPRKPFGSFAPASWNVGERHVVGAKSASEIGLAQNAPGVDFHCRTCEYIKAGTCTNPNPKLNGRKVEPDWCCNLYDHDGMKVIV